MKNLYFLLFILPFIFGHLSGFAQTYKKVNGKIADTSGIAIAHASIVLVDQKDTLRTKTDEYGSFSITKIKGESFELNVSVMGYQTYSQTYTFAQKKQLNINTIELQLADNMLKEVVIKSKPNPIRLMQDTVEYNAAAFKVFEGDNVADLIKQFPGIEVDDEYNVKSMGQDVVKLRVNGKDFFTNDVKEFIAKLPAEIVSKIQIIDDYGDQANFTGLKVGEPQKLINIVTKPGMNRGKFGNMSITAGSNQQLGSRNNVNLWNDDKQTGASLNYLMQNNGAGNSDSKGATINHRDKIGKNGNFGINYSANQNSNDFTNEQAVETVSDAGSYYNFSQNSGNTKNTRHNLNSNFYLSNQTIYVNGSIAGSYSQHANNRFSLNNQTGLTKQDFKNFNETEGNSPSLNANFSLSKKRSKKRGSLSANFGFSLSNQQSNQLINTNTLYYNQQDLTLLKDSVLNRNIDSRNRTQSFSFSTNYIMPLNKATDTTGNRTISFNYALSLNNNTNQTATYVLSNLTNSYRFVDSLSSALTSLFITQTLGIGYNYTNKKMRFSLGLNARPTMLRNNYINIAQKIVNNNFNYSPSLNLSRTLEKGKTLSLGYSGSNNSPSANQLQPIRNTQNLQNIIIGNPNLKAFFQHRLNANYNYVEAKSGASMFVSANFSTTQNEIVNNVIVVPDTLGSYRQETRYENTNGTYNLSGNYNINIPLKKNVFSVGYSGTIGVSNKALFINNIRYFNSGLNFSQNISGNINLKKMSFNTGLGYSQVNNNNILGLANSFSSMALGQEIMLTGGGITLLNLPSINSTFNPGQLTTTNFFMTRTFSANLNARLKLSVLNLSGGANYSYSSNSNTSVQHGDRDLKTLSLSLNGNATVKKTYRIGFSAAKRINSGYAIANQNPLLIGLNLSKQMLKNNSLSITASASDLLNQGNMISRQVLGNSVIDSKNNVITRVFSFGLSYNLSKFGTKGTNIRVDPD
ncbi:outer membrane beta-barrel protein [Pedobacter sp. ASV28]|uniref:outer membrane beta-barrel protein n=1 Tax=Pedobacter sp. ASV28 TaxID=2795123 RepID=UPI0018EB359E|nr:outer membrane beta-barrel protein [Pedobacter sp. ASV28]